MGSFITQHPNLGLIVKKRYVEANYTHCFITNKLTDKNFLGGESYIFPLYNYSQNIGFSVSNIHPVFEEKLNGMYSKNGLTEDIFNYLYAILYSNVYRQQFASLLKMNFPRIPFPKSYELFDNISKLGKKLINLHLLLSPELSKPIIKFIGDGDCLVQSLQYDAVNQRLYINDNQYFSNISKRILEFEVGNNKVVQQYFKGKDNKVLSLSDTIQFCKITSAIEGTFNLQKDIDQLYPAIIDNIFELEFNSVQGLSII